MNNTIRKIVKKVVAMLIVLTLTLADLSWVGINLVSYAVDTIGTNNQNVDYNVYFDTSSQSTEIDAEIEKNDVNLIIELGVKKDGYLSEGKIQLDEQSNFTFKKDINDSHINKIEERTVELKQINEGDSIKIKLPVEFSYLSEFDANYLNKESSVKLSGKYINSKKKDIEINGEAKVKLNWKSGNEIKSILNTEVLTNSTYKVEEVNKKIIQIIASSKIENNSYPIKETKLFMNIPQEPERVTVHKRTTNATNGDKAFDSNNYEYKDGKLSINIKNDNDKISWQKNVEDILIVTIQYPETTDINNLELKTESVINTLDDKELKQESNVVINEEKEGIITNSIEEKQQEISKGNLYTGDAKTYNVKSNLYIDYANPVEDINLTEQKSTFVSDKEKDANIEFVKTEIDKNEFTEIFGQDGTITIKDGEENTISNITNTTETNENGKIVIKYDKGINNISITTSKPQKEGTIGFEHEKNILKTDYTREEINEITELKDSDDVKYLLNSSAENTTQNDNTIPLKETESKATLSVEPTTLSTATDQEVNMKVVLKTDSEKYDLYKNPTVKIKLPKQIKSINVQCKLMYGNGLELDSIKAQREDDQEVITVKLKGEQENYPGEAEEGPTLILKAIVGLDKYATNSNEQIVLNYTNDFATTYANDGEEKVNVNIVSQNSMILTNDVYEYDIRTLGKEENKEIDITKSDVKKATIFMRVINNEGTDLSNIAIIGKIANIEGTLERTSKIHTNTETAKIYYTNVENPTLSLDNAENKWTEENIKDAKNFLVVVSSLEKNKELELNYNVTVKDNMAFNQNTYTSYKVEYTNELTEARKTAESSTITFTTGKVAEVKGNITAKVSGEEVNENTDVKAGEIITYDLVVENTGTQTANNINFDITIPDNTTLIEVNPKYPSYDETMDHYTKDEEFLVTKPDKNFSINEKATIEAGKKYTYSYMVMVNKDVKETKNIETKVAIRQEEKQLAEVTKINKIISGDIQVTCIPMYRKPDTVLDVGFNYVYYINIKNLTDKEQKNIEVALNKNDILNINTLYWNIDEEHFGELDKNKTKFTLESLPANGETKVIVNATPVVGKTNMSEISATVKSANKEYKSNQLIENVRGVQVQADSSSEVISSNAEKGYLNIGDKIRYTINLKNIGKFDANELEIKNEITNYLDVSKVTLDGKEIEYDIETYSDEKSIVTINSQLKTGSEATLQIEGTVIENLPQEDNLELSHISIIYNDSVELAHTNEIKYKIINNNSNSNNNSGSNNQAGTYSISGTVWKDLDKNGSRDPNEELLEGINVFAINVETNQVAIDNNGSEIFATTNSEGNYSLQNMPKGEYIVGFEYDTERYVVTLYRAEGINNSENSDAVTATRKINGEEKIAAFTDSIKLEQNETDIDLGLAEAKVFSLRLEKTISKMIVTNQEGTKTYDFDDKNLAKVEIASKSLSDSNVIIEYKMKVINDGEIAGYANSIVDYIPSSLTFNSGLNNDWYQKGNNIYTSSLADTKIEPGETKEIKLTLTKKMTESNTGLTNNKAEIESSYNTLGVPNTASTSSDNKTKNLGSADAIISVKTGTAVSYVSLTFTIVIVIFGLAYLINKKLLVDKIQI